MLLRWLLGVQLSIPTTEQEAPKRRGRGSSTAVCGAGAGPHDGEAVSEADSEATDDGEGVEERKDGERVADDDDAAVAMPTKRSKTVTGAVVSAAAAQLDAPQLKTTKQQQQQKQQKKQQQKKKQQQQSPWETCGTARESEISDEAQKAVTVYGVSMAEFVEAPLFTVGNLAEAHVDVLRAVKRHLVDHKLERWWHETGILENALVPAAAAAAEAAQAGSFHLPVLPRAKLTIAVGLTAAGVSVLPLFMLALDAPDGAGVMTFRDAVQNDPAFARYLRAGTPTLTVDNDGVFAHYQQHIRALTDDEFNAWQVCLDAVPVCDVRPLCVGGMMFVSTAVQATPHPAVPV